MSKKTRGDGGVTVHPPYIRKLLEAYAGGAIPAGSVGECTVRHDDWCAIWHGKPCNCEPDIEVVYSEVRR